MRRCGPVEYGVCHFDVRFDGSAEAYMAVSHAAVVNQLNCGSREAIRSELTSGPMAGVAQDLRRRSSCRL